MHLPEVLEYKKIIDKLGKVQIGILGGEPTLHPKLYDIINLFTDHDVKVYTNGLRPLKRIKGQYSVTCHEFKDIRRILDNINSVRDLVSKVKIMLDGNNLDEALSASRKFMDEGFSVEFRAIDDHYEYYQGVPENIIENTPISEVYYKEENGEVQEIKLEEYGNIDFSGLWCLPHVISLYPNNKGTINCTMINNIRKNIFKPIKCQKSKCRLCYLESTKYDHT